MCVYFAYKYLVFVELNSINDVQSNFSKCKKLSKK